MPRPILRGKVFYSDIWWGGKRIQRALSKDKRTAQRMVDEMVLQRRAEKYGTIPTQVSWQFFKQRYFEYSRGSKAKQTVYRDDLSFRMLESMYPIQRLDQITPELLERVKNAWKKAGKNDPTINRALRALKAAMHKAEAWNYIKKENWGTVKLYKESKGRLVYYKVEDVKGLLKRTSGCWHTIIMLGARAGLRRGEIYHLEWSDVDFERNRIHISAKEDWHPKDYERRWVPMSDDLNAYLDRIRGPWRWVLGRDRPTLDSMTTYFKRLVKQAKLVGGIHTLRHTFASHLVSNGASLEQIAKLLGHSNTRATHVYAHLSPESTETVINKLPTLAS